VSEGYVDPVERFLGREAAAGGAFALLGISSTSATRDGILRAIDQRMAQLDAHEDANTPQADEVRLALHSAAGRLLESEVRRDVLGLNSRAAQPAIPEIPPPLVHLPPPVPARAPGGAAPGGPRVPPASAQRSDASRVRREIAAAVAIAGGWNARARSRLMLLSSKYGISVRALAIAARASGTGSFGIDRPSVDLPAPRVHEAIRVTPRARSAQTGADRTERAVRSFLALAGIAFVATCVVVIAIAVRSLDESGRHESAGKVAVPGPATGVKTPEGDVAATRAPEDRPRNVDLGSRDLTKPAAVVRELQDARDDLDFRTTEGLGRFDTAVRALARLWAEYPPDQLDAAHDAVLGFVYRLGDTPVHAQAATESIAHGLAEFADDDPAAVWPAAWSSGMLARLRRERDLPATVRRTAERTLGTDRPDLRVDAPTFRRGAVAFLRSHAAHLARRAPVADEAWTATWTTWADAVVAVSGPDEAFRVVLVTYGLESLLLGGASVEASPEMDRAVTMLADRLAWRDDDGSRPWLVQRFDDRRVPSAALAVLTRAIAGSSAAEGIDASMVLSVRATALDRRSMRDRYAEAWGVDVGSVRGRAAAEVRAAILASLDEPRTVSAEPDVDAIAGAAIFARLNAAAAAAWRGDDTDAFDLLDALDTPVAAITGGLSGRVVSSATDAPFPAGGAWGEEYLLARANVPRRSELLDDLGRGRRLGAVDADVLVLEAFLGSPRKIRDQAHDLVIGPYGSQPVVVNAILDILPRVPRSERSSVTIEIATGVPLPDPDDPTWSLSARRALVERALEVLAASGSLGVIESLAAVLDEAYERRLSGGPATSAKLSASEAAVLMRERLLGELNRAVPPADPAWSPSAIAARRLARLGVADGVVQRFAAEQAALAETMASLVIAERAAAASRVRDIGTELGAARRGAAHVLWQIEATERAMAQLWIERFGG
jgi:hypothetical protein